MTFPVASTTTSLFLAETQKGDVPSPRFGHTTTLVSDSTVILFGGATGEGGSYTINNETFVFDIKRQLWRRIAPAGAPVARAAHAAASVDTNQMVVYGGAVGGGGLCSDELHLLDNRVDGGPQWLQVPVEGPTPGKRYGHTMVYSRPSLIVFGGNDGTSALNDVWTMDAEKAPFSWVKLQVVTPTKSPAPRVYHSAEMCLSGPATGMMVIFGGRNGESRPLKDAWGLRQHRDGRWDWVEAPAKKGTLAEARFQHSACFWKSKMFVFGGRASDVTIEMPTSVYDTETCEWKDFESTERFRHSLFSVSGTGFIFGGFNHEASSVPTGDLKSIDLENPGSARKPLIGESTLHAPSSAVAAAAIPRSVSVGAVDTRTSFASPSVQTQVGLSHQVYVAVDRESLGSKIVGIDSLEEEHKKTSDKFANVSAPQRHGHVVETVCEQLLNRIPDLSQLSGFFLSGPEIISLCEWFEGVVKKQPMVLRLRAPIKVYGDIHGQFPDLLRLFSRYGTPTEPSEGGDIDAMDYLFLGDYVDRGAFSLETVCLLFALKCRHPTQIHLLRGNHEDAAINGIYGFKDECRRRLREDPDAPGSVYQAINRAFEWLPVAAIIEEQILCIHGGIGGAIESVAQLEQMQRPLKVAQSPTTVEEQRVTDLLWSDPTDSDTMLGVLLNETRDPDGTGRIFKFGPDRVDQFLKANHPLCMIVRAHECVMDGFERFAGGRVITVFSATDYCGHHKNAGALLFIRRDLTVVPKLIYPVERSLAVGNWDATNIKQRPPTPPRSPRSMGRDAQ